LLYERIDDLPIKEWGVQGESEPAGSARKGDMSYRITEAGRQEVKKKRKT
jgi:hypothetical protein